MNVAFYTDTYLPNVDGVVTSMVNYRRELERRGERVYIFSSGDRKDRLENKDGHVFFFPSIRFPLYKQYKIALFPYYDASRIAREKKIDLIHCHGIVSMALAAIKTSRDLDKPLVGTFHTMVPTAAGKSFGKPAERIAWRMISSLYAKFDLVTCPSKTIQGILKQKGVESVVVPNAVDVKRFNPHVDGSAVKRALGAEKIVLVAGRVSQEKNVSLVVRAMARVLKEAPDAKLVITGDGPDRANVEKAIEETGIANRVVLTGFLKSQDLPLYYAASDCLVTASTFETQGLSMLETMACGKPAVGAKAMAIPEAIREGRNGFLFTPGNEGECAEKILKVLNGKKSAVRAMGANAHKTAMEFSIEKSTAKLERAYAKVL